MNTSIISPLKTRQEAVSALEHTLATLKSEFALEIESETLDVIRSTISRIVQNKVDAYVHGRFRDFHIANLAQVILEIEAMQKASVKKSKTRQQAQSDGLN